MAKVGKNGRVEESWVDIVIAFQRAIRSFDIVVRPLVRSQGRQDLGVSNLLMLLSIGEGSRRLSDLVRLEGYGNSNASYALKTLLEYGLVVKAVAEDDRRVKIVRPSEDGLNLIRRIKAAAAADEGEVGEAIALVTTFEDRLRHGVARERGRRGGLARGRRSVPVQTSPEEDPLNGTREAPVATAPTERPRTDPFTLSIGTAR